jgi:hypothetical protein
MALFRQGDVYVEDLKVIPEGGRRRDSPVLFLGEATGHAHRFEPADAADVLELGNQLYLRVVSPLQIVHEEHGPIPLDPGLYRVWRQREYTSAGGWRGVQD